MNCRHCNKSLKHTFLDLGFAPPSNAYLKEEDLKKNEIYYPLRIKVCDSCWLVQTEDYAEADALFNNEYAYFSSTSTSWMSHAKKYTENIIKELGLGSNNMVIELASNDGYLLKNFLSYGIPCLGIEPTDSTATAAEKIGIKVIREFFTEDFSNQLISDGLMADLVIGNNVYAHVPDINDFTMGMKSILKPEGTITLEFPHLMRLIEMTQFDTVYHEHFSYLSLYTVCRIFEAAELRVYKVEELSTHGGSLRIYGCHKNDERKNHDSVKELLEREKLYKLRDLHTYTSFQSSADKIKDNLLSFLIKEKNSGKEIIAYGAAAKGNTLLNYAGVKNDLIRYVCDGSTAKQGLFMPGSHIPIFSPNYLVDKSPDYIIILPWNLADEIRDQNIEFEKRGTKFLTAVPDLKIL